MRARAPAGSGGGPARGPVRAARRAPGGGRFDGPKLNVRTEVSRRDAGGGDRPRRQPRRRAGPGPAKAPLSAAAPPQGLSLPPASTLHAPLPLGVPPESRVPGGGSPTLRLPGQASLRVMTSPTSARAIPLPQPLRLIVTGPAPGRRPRPPPDSNHGDARGPPCPARVGAGRIGADWDKTSMSSLAGRACQVRSKVRHAGPFSYSRVPR